MGVADASVRLGYQLKVSPVFSASVDGLGALLDAPLVLLLFKVDSGNVRQVRHVGCVKPRGLVVMLQGTLKTLLLIGIVAQLLLCQGL